ncbi:MAG: polyprenyl synthetase family protein [Chloroflexi bacterium]|nr:polyprenyl synthetase family protein [Chloroflexota bacterium]
MEAYLKVFVGHSPRPLDAIMRYHLGWEDTAGRAWEGVSGKRLRPLLCILVCDAVGGDYRRALPAAAALELIHNFSLIHDDVQDASPERHHRPTVWRLWGVPQAINAGDGMFALACLAALHLEEVGVAPQLVTRVSGILAHACLELCRGQYLDIHYESCPEVTLVDYLKMIGQKTAALITASFEVGALLGTEDEGMVARLRECGRAWGLAFQMRDDILGVWGDERVTGKPTGGDIRAKKKSLPVVWALEKAPTPLRESLLTIYGRESLADSDVARVEEILAALDSRRCCLEMVVEHYQRGLAELEASGLAMEEQASLRAVGQFLVTREH